MRWASARPPSRRTCTACSPRPTPGARPTWSSWWPPSPVRSSTDRGAARERYPPLHVFLIVLHVNRSVDAMPQQPWHSSAHNGAAHTRGHLMETTMLQLHPTDDHADSRQLSPQQWDELKQAVARRAGVARTQVRRELLGRIADAVRAASASL